MITYLATATVFVRDQDRAVEFYVNQLGFEKRTDQPMGPDSRWIEVAPPGATSFLLLYKPTPEMPGADSYDAAIASIGKMSTVLLACDDLKQTYETLSVQGVKFPTPAEQQPWGWWAVLEDPDGNSFGLTQRS